MIWDDSICDSTVRATSAIGSGRSSPTYTVSMIPELFLPSCYCLGAETTWSRLGVLATTTRFCETI